MSPRATTNAASLDLGRVVKIGSTGAMPMSKVDAAFHGEQKQWEVKFSPKNKE